MENYKASHLDTSFGAVSHVYCLNCGKYGHYTKKCLYPIISLGIIGFQWKVKDVNWNLFINYSKKLQNKYLFSSDELKQLNFFYMNISKYKDVPFDEMIKYLFIRRKNSLNYIEFIRGKYNLMDVDYLQNALHFLTLDEKKKIQENDFDTLWHELWDNNYSKNQKEYNESKLKFNTLREGFYIMKNEIKLWVQFDSIIQNSFFHYTEPEWGFPKGRREENEKNIDCAKREFQEETNLKENEYKIIHISPFEETYLATNNIKYRHIYYIAQVYHSSVVAMDSENKCQNMEVGDIQFLSIHEGLEKIRNYNIEKKHSLINLHLHLKLIYENFFALMQNRDNRDNTYK
jgi:8-oxo-dGTP pyrophosphatase MutT (NUDIX family)